MDPSDLSAFLEALGPNSDTAAPPARGSGKDGGEDGSPTALAVSVARLVESDDADGLKALHDSGKWTDLDMVVDSEKGPDGITDGTTPH